MSASGSFLSRLPRVLLRCPAVQQGPGGRCRAACRCSFRDIFQVLMSGAAGARLSTGGRSIAAETGAATGEQWGAQPIASLLHL